MGRIGATHGLRGEVRLISFTQNAKDIANYGPLQTSRPGLTITIDKLRWPKTKQTSSTQNTLIASLKDIKDCTSAEKLTGVELFVPKEKIAPSSEEDGYLYADLIGLQARFTDGSLPGKVLSLQNFGAGDLLEIEQADKKIIMVAFTRKNVPNIHIAQNYLDIELPTHVMGKKVE